MPQLLTIFLNYFLSIINAVNRLYLFKKEILYNMSGHLYWLSEMLKSVLQFYNRRLIISIIFYLFSLSFHFDS